MELDMLKEEILDWIKAQPKGKKFTSADVYIEVDSAEDPAKVSDVLRGLAKSNILDRHEFMEGNRKRFTYWLAEERKAAPEPKNALNRMGGFSPAPSGLIKNVKIFDDSNKGKQPEPEKEEVKESDEVRNPKTSAEDLVDEYVELQTGAVGLVQGTYGNKILVDILTKSNNDTHKWADSLAKVSISQVKRLLS